LEWRIKDVTRVELNLQQERQQAHALLDQLPPAKPGVSRSLLAVMVDDNHDDDFLYNEDNIPCADTGCRSMARTDWRKLSS
jgi:hypothetical protein